MQHMTVILIARPPRRGTSVAAGFVFAALIAMFAGCRQNDEPGTATDLLAQVTADDYRGWDRAPGYEKRKPANSPHSDDVEIFVNDTVLAALAEPGAKEWPLNSIIVKEGYSSDGAHELTAIMQKREAGWFWAEYDAKTGKPSYSGKPTICTDCHATGSDFVRAFRLP